ncbi:response regulator [Agarilytica rhodophyticola]|uniref:response regulator n=1 Tax=Agarilytica rhodophyticola TaxID=1737490 RepID=UPI000B341CA8|nr:response regulator [Agarilytica rhodophyticola]
MDNKTILFVDDERSVLKAIKRVFIREPCNILIAESGEEGLTLLEKEQVHLVVSDQRMPKMSGSAFLKTVRDLYPHTIRIIMSGYADISAVIEGVNQAHISHFLTKPWETEDLKKAVMHYLAIAPESGAALCSDQIQDAQHCDYYRDLQTIIYEQKQEIESLRSKLEKQ